MTPSPPPRPLLILHALFLLLLASSVLGTRYNYNPPCPNSPCPGEQECDEPSFICNCPRGFIKDFPLAKNCSIAESYPCTSTPTDKHKCVANAVCSPVQGQGQNQHNGHHHQTRCQCSSGFLRDGHGKCALAHGARCGSTGDLPCANRFLLHCSENVKECRCAGEGRDYVWDEDRKKCVSLVGNLCDYQGGHDPSQFTPDDLLECVSNARCNVHGRCECVPGWTLAPEGEGGGCLVDHGGLCDGVSGSGNGSEVKLPCDRSKLLFCGSAGLCGCEFHGQMEWNGESCVMLAGEFCDLDEETGSHFCGEGAVCVAKGLRGQKGKGVCSCVEGKFKSQTGHCTPVRGHGMSCTLAADCDSGAFLTCVVGGELDGEGGGSCDCEPHGMTWMTSSQEGGRGQCVVRPGQSCSRNRICAPNSSCSGDLEICLCDEGYFLEDTSGDCVSDLGTTTRVPPISLSTTSQTTTTSGSLGSLDEVGVTPKGLSKAEIPSSTPPHRPIIPIIIISSFLVFWS